jgi:alpha-aminoadipate/glutamate carrier protein LysW
LTSRTVQAKTSEAVSYDVVILQHERLKTPEREDTTMPSCPECENNLDIEEDELEEGDVVACDECGTEFEVVGVEPLELTRVEEGIEDEDEEMYDEDEEEE